jgi:DNA polymerase-3 subunit gamma/tau
MRSHDPSESFAIVEEIMRSGYDIQEFLIGLSEHFRNFLTVLSTGATNLIETARSIKERYGEESQSMEQGDIIRALHLTLAAQQAIRTASQPRLRLELALIQLAVMDSTVSLTALLEKIDRMPEGGSGNGDRGPGNGDQGSGERGKGPGTRDQAGAGARGNGRGGAPADAAAPSKRVADLTDLASFPTQPPPGSVSSRAVEAPVMATVRMPETTADPAMPPNGTISGIAYGAPPSIGQIQSKWGEFLKSCEDRRSVVAMLDKLQPAEIAAGTIRLYVENEAQQTMLMRSRDVLAERLTGFFGAPLRIEAVIGAVPAIRAEAGPSNVGREQLEHPFIRGIVELLGAATI